MRYGIHSSANSEEQFENSIPRYHIFSLYWNRDEEKIHRYIREYKRKTEEDSEDRTGGTDCHHSVFHLCHSSQKAPVTGCLSLLHY